MRQSSAYHRPSSAQYLIGGLLQISWYNCKLGKFSRAQQFISRAMGVINRSRLGPKAYSDIIDVYYQQAWIALAVDNRNESQRIENAYFQAVLRKTQYSKGQGRLGALGLSWIYEAGFETADTLLMFGANPASLCLHVNTGIRYLKLYAPKKNKKELEKMIKKDYANVAAIFLGK